MDDLSWDENRLAAYARRVLGPRELVVVSQRQPVLHMASPLGPRAVTPASGLVTAVLPMVQACSGTWVAEASGDADHAVVDAAGEVQMAHAGRPWRLRRVWLPPALRRQHSDGFANGGLWPACHAAAVEPRFEPHEWRAYQVVNRRFADAVLAGLRGAQPVIHVHDYHLCLVPEMLRAAAPQATLVHFWHVPWPQQQRLQACPWHAELVRGLAAADAVVFQTAADAARFDAACSRLGVRGARARAVPISIAWPAAGQAAPPTQHGMRTVRTVLGVDRFDYTKGLLERIAGFACLLAAHPEWHGRVRMLQVAAPTREAVPAYRAYRQRVLAQVAAINRRFGTPQWQPVEWRARVHSADEVQALYRQADVCLVSSVADGMNLVCKEYVAARADDSGCLVLSRAAGAVHELHDALLTDPLDPADVADTLHRALLMPAAEQQRRMRQLRAVVRNFNGHRWAARLLAAGPSAVLKQQRASAASVLAVAA